MKPGNHLVNYIVNRCIMEKLEEMQRSVVRQDANETEGKCLQHCGQTSSVVWCRDLSNSERTRSTTRSK